MKTETHSKKHEHENVRDFEVFRKRLLAELKKFQDRVARARQELPIDSDPDDEAGIASRSAHREVTMGNLERDVRGVPVAHFGCPPQGYSVDTDLHSMCGAWQSVRGLSITTQGKSRSLVSGAATAST